MGAVAGAYTVPTPNRATLVAEARHAEAPIIRRVGEGRGGVGPAQNRVPITLDVGNDETDEIERR